MRDLPLWARIAAYVIYLCVLVVIALAVMYGMSR